MQYEKSVSGACAAPVRLSDFMCVFRNTTDYPALLSISFLEVRKFHRAVSNPVMLIIPVCRKIAEISPRVFCLRSPVPQTVGNPIAHQPFCRIGKIQSRTVKPIDIIKRIKPEAGFIIVKLIRKLAGQLFRKEPRS